MELKSIAVVGPTASGKTGRAVDIARRFHTEIISADSRQVYCGMDLGTGKDLEEYEEIPYHLIDVAPAGSKYNLHQYLSGFRQAYADMTGRGLRPVICGGSGLYVESALSGIVMPEVNTDPQLRESLKRKTLEELTEILRGYKKLHNTTDVDTPARAIRAIEIERYYEAHPEAAVMADRKKAKPIPALIVGVDIPREERRHRISERLDRRLENGMIDEVRMLVSSGISPDDLIYYGLEYKYLTLHVTGRLTYQEMRDSLEIAIHQFAKRQMTWFRGMERRGFRINWLPYDLGREEFTGRVAELLESEESLS